MRDFANSTYQRKKVARNKIKIQRKPIEFKKYLRPLKMIITGLIFFTLTICIIYGTYRAVSKVTLFSLKSIEVTSAKHLTREEILGLAGIEPGKDLLRMNLQRMGEHILQNPWVETVRINR